MWNSSLNGLDHAGSVSGMPHDKTERLSQYRYMCQSADCNNLQTSHNYFDAASDLGSTASSSSNLSCFHSEAQQKQQFISQ